MKSNLILFVPPLLATYIFAALVVVVEDQIISPKGGSRPLSSIEAFNHSVSDQQGNLFSKRMDEISPKMLQQARDQLKCFLDDLKLHIHPLMFSLKSFQQHSKEFESRLLDLAVLVMGMSPRQENLVKRYNFVFSIYKEMSDMIFLTELFPRSSGPQHKILNCIYQVNLTLMTFRDATGAPDPSIENYSTLLEQYKETFENWKSNYKKGGAACIPMGIEYTRQVKKIEQNFEELEGALKNPESSKVEPSTSLDA